MNNTISTWRDLTGLTAAQEARLAQREELFLADGRPQELVAEMLLWDAVNHVSANIVDREKFGHLPEPAGATYVWHWGISDEGNWEREFQCREWNVGCLSIDILGTQYADGRLTYRLLLAANGLTFNTTGAKALADAMTAAAVELERLDGGAR